MIENFASNNVANNVTTVASQLIRHLRSIGFFDIILPFILVYALIYGLLMRIKLFGKEEDRRVRSLNSLISFAFAGIIVGSVNTVKAIQESIPIIIVFLIVVLGIVLVGSFTLAQEYEKLVQTKKWQVIGLLLTIMLGLTLLIAFNLISIEKIIETISLTEEMGIKYIITSLTVAGTIIAVVIYFARK